MNSDVNSHPLFKYLSCIYCHTSLHFNSTKSQLMCSECKHVFPIIENIPIFLSESDLTNHDLKQIDFFDSRKYSDKFDYQLDPWQIAFLKRFRNHISDVDGKLVVDNATGPGYFAIELAKRGGKVIATDLSYKSLLRIVKIAEAKGLSDHILCVCCSSENLPLRNGVADIIIANAILEHLHLENAAINEINRVSKDHTRLMINVPIKFKYVNPLLIPLNVIHDRMIGHLRRYDKKSIQTRFPDWEIVATYYTGHFKKVMKTLLNLIIKIFDEKEMEREDEDKSLSIYSSTNITCFLEK